MEVRQNQTKPSTITKAAIANSVRRESNTTLRGNQISLQLGNPKSHSEAARAINLTEFSCTSESYEGIQAQKKLLLMLRTAQGASLVRRTQCTSVIAN